MFHTKTHICDLVSRSQTQFFPFSWGRGKERVWSTPVERFVLSAPKFWCALIDHHLVSGKAITAVVTMNLIKVHMHFIMAAAASLVKCCLCKSDPSPVNLRKKRKKLHGITRAR